MLARLCSKSFKLGFRSRWSKNFQMDFKEAEEPEIKLSTFAGSWQKQGSSRKTSTAASLTMLKTDCVDHNKLWKILKMKGIPDYLTCLLRNLYVGQEATVRTGHGTTNWFQIGKGVVRAVYCHPAYLTYMQNTSFKMTGWMNHKLESRLLGEISTTSDMQIMPSWWQKVKRN